MSIIESLRLFSFFGIFGLFWFNFYLTLNVFRHMRYGSKQTARDLRARIILMAFVFFGIELLIDSLNTGQPPFWPIFRLIVATMVCVTLYIRVPEMHQPRK